MVIDTHSHINDEIYTDLDRIITEMKQDNLEKIVCASADYVGSKRAVELASKYKDIYAMVGIHPEDIDSFNDEVIQFLTNACDNPKVVAIGEIGLDYHYDNIDKEKQKQVFVRQLQIAHEKHLPVVIHVRDAYEDLLNILKASKSILADGGIIHCFSGSYEFACEVIKLGFVVAFGGVLTFKNARKSVEVAGKLPLDKIVVETDAPWLCPEPHRGERNEPKYVNYVVQKLADIRQMDRESLEKVLLDNTYKVFGKMER